MARGFALASLVVGGLIVANLLYHWQTTNMLIKATTSESRLLAGRG